MARKLLLRTAAVACTLALLAGCGGGASSSTPEAGAANTAASLANATGTLTIRYPAGFATVRNGLSSKRHAAYVNPTAGNTLDIAVNGNAVPGSPFAVAATADSTQTIGSVPFYSNLANGISVVEYDPNGDQLATALSTSNPVSPGATTPITLTLQMNATRIGFTTDPAAGSDALLLSAAGLPTPFCMSGSEQAYAFPADPSNGFVLPGTPAGIGGIPSPVMTSQSTAGSSKILPEQIGMGVTFDGAYDPITANFQVLDPVNGAYYYGSALLFRSANCAQPSVVNVNVSNFSPPSPYDTAYSAPASSASFPIVAYQGYEYLAYSDFNNDVDFFIAKYDSQYNLVSVNSFGGDRYIGFITIDTVAQTVTFNGQYEEADLGPGVTLTWAQLSAL